MFSRGGDMQDDRDGHSSASVLHFLQREFTRFECDRAKWHEEKALYTARIAFLEGQRAGDVNVKRDLLRRIKMLEHVLRKERAQTAGKPAPAGPDTSIEAIEASIPKNRPSVGGKKIKEGREILFKYLTEMGCTDDILRSQAQRLKATFETWPPTHTNTLSTDGAQQQRTQRKEDLDLEATARLDEDDSESPVDPVAAFDEMLDEVDEDEDEDEDEDGDEDDGQDDDGDYNEEEDADGLDDFEMTTGDDGAADAPAESPSGPDAAADVPSAEPQQAAAEENEGELEEDFLAKFGAAGGKLMKRQSRKSKKDKSRGSKSTSQRTHMQDLFADPSEDNAATAEAEPALAELFDLDGSEKKKKDEESSYLAAEQSLNTLRKDWKVNQDLRNHLDVVQGIAFHQTKLRLASASEDMTVKVWDLDPHAKKSSQSDPVATFHGHTAAVLTVAMASKSDVLYSAGADGAIHKWRMPPVGSERNLPYDAEQQLAVASEHSDAVWSLDLHKDEHLLMSASADGTCRLWATGEDAELAPSSVISPGLGALSCGEFVASNSNLLILGHTSGAAGAYDVNTGKAVVTFDVGEDPSSISCVRSHHTTPMVAAADETKRITFYNLDSGERLHSMVAHQGPVSCISFDPSGLYMVSSGHDRSIRVWDIAAKTCNWERPRHLPLRDEAISAVLFHPTLPYFASAGADSTITLWA